MARRGRPIWLSVQACVAGLWLTGGKEGVRWMATGGECVGEVKVSLQVPVGEPLPTAHAKSISLFFGRRAIDHHRERQSR
jgi:hypothetical protein